MSVPAVSSYRSMEPVASHWKEHNKLGRTLVDQLAGQGFRLFEGGAMEMDLTQTSYSTIPSVDLELGDKTSDHGAERLGLLADGILAGLNVYFAS